MVQLANPFLSGLLCRRIAPVRSNIDAAMAVQEFNRFVPTFCIRFLGLVLNLIRTQTSTPPPPPPPFTFRQWGKDLRLGDHDCSTYATELVYHLSGARCKL